MIDTLKYLFCKNTRIEKLPFLPYSLNLIELDNSRYLIDPYKKYYADYQKHKNLNKFYSL